MRDIFNIAKKDQLQAVLAKRIAEQHTTIKDIVDRFEDEDDFYRMMEWSDKMFEAAAWSKLYKFLSYALDRWFENKGRCEYTIDELKEIVALEYRYLSPLPRSSSPSHNLAEQSLLNAAMEFGSDSVSSAYRIHWSAQRLDDEYKVACEARAEADRAEKARKDAAEAAAKHEAALAKRRARAAEKRAQKEGL